MVVYLDARGCYIDDEIAAFGDLAVIHGRYRPLVERALAAGARGILVAHNHPSGAARPSSNDVRFTRALLALGRALDLRIHDHLVVTATAIFSIRQRSIL